MTVAVLKNRLLQLTNRAFSEEAYGAKSLVELFSQYHDLIAIDLGTRPPTVEWRETNTVAPEPDRPGRVRADLWQAVLDYASGKQFEWDTAHAQARAVGVAEPTRRLPTLDATVLAAWRKSFVDEHVATLTEADDQERLKHWSEKGLGTQHVPKRLQSAWNAYLKRQVIERLEQWFSESDIMMPKLIAEPHKSLSTASPATSALRQFVHRCVDMMSERELEGLVLPAGTVFRAQGH